MLTLLGVSITYKQICYPRLVRVIVDPVDTGPSRHHYQCLSEGIGMCTLG